MKNFIKTKTYVLFLSFLVLISCGGEQTNNHPENETTLLEKELDSISEDSQMSLELEGVYHLTNSAGGGRLCIYQTESGAYIGYLSFHSGAPAYNMGTLTGCLTKQDQTWVLSQAGEEEQCEVELIFKRDSLHLHFDKNKNICPFGVNANPTGLYLKTNTKEDELVLENMFQEMKDCVVKIYGDNEDQKINYCNCEYYEKKKSSYAKELKRVKYELGEYFDMPLYDLTSDHYGWSWKAYWFNALDSLIGILKNNPQEPLLFEWEQTLDFTGNGTQEHLLYYVGYNKGFKRGIKLIRNHITMGELDLTEDIAFENLHIIHGDFINEVWLLNEKDIIHKEMGALTEGLFPWMCLLKSYDLEKSRPPVLENNKLQKILSKAVFSNDNETIDYIKNYKGLLISTDEWGYDGTLYTIWHEPSKQWLRFGVSVNENEMNIIQDFEFF